VCSKDLGDLACVNVVQSDDATSLWLGDCSETLVGKCAPERTNIGGDIVSPNFLRVPFAESISSQDVGEGAEGCEEPRHLSGPGRRDLGLQSSAWSVLCSLWFERSGAGTGQGTTRERHSQHTGQASCKLLQDVASGIA
jgi:hypothetical protein